MNNSLTLTVSKSEKGKHKKENQKTNQETTTKSTEKNVVNGLAHRTRPMRYGFLNKLRPFGATSPPVS
jgi:hypothetical protein